MTTMMGMRFLLGHDYAPGVGAGYLRSKTISTRRFWARPCRGRVRGDRVLFAETLLAESSGRNVAARRYWSTVSRGRSTATSCSGTAMCDRDVVGVALDNDRVLVLVEIDQRRDLGPAADSSRARACPARVEQQLVGEDGHDQAALVDLRLDLIRPSVCLRVGVEPVLEREKSDCSWEASCASFISAAHLCLRGCCRPGRSASGSSGSAARAPG